MFGDKYIFVVGCLAFSFNYTSQVGSDDLPPRKRGRPMGKRRVPLSLEQRRARNAQYERERRNETAEAMAQLAEAAGCEPSISNTDLLMTVINRLQKAALIKSTDNIKDMKKNNDVLMSQIETLESRLKYDCNEKDSSKHNNLIHQTKLRTIPELQDTGHFHQYNKRTTNPKKKMKITFQDDIRLDVPSKWTSKAVTKSNVNSNLQQKVKIELLKQFDSHPDKSFTRSEPGLYRLPIVPVIKEEKQDAFDETKFQPKPTIKNVHQYLNSARASDYFSNIELSSSNQNAQDGSEFRISKKIPSNKMQNQIQKGLTKEKQMEKTTVLNLLTDNEKVLFGDIEWLTESEHKIQINGNAK